MTTRPPQPENDARKSGRKTRGRARQLVLDLPLAPGMGREDFLETPANAAALRAISHWPSGAEGEAHALVLIGPEGSGKSHLAEIWRLENDALKAHAADLRVEAVPHLLARGALVLEDLPADAARAPEWETALFHLLNMARQEGAHVLLTSCRSPARWPVALPDLRSRLAALPVAEIEPPDDMLLRAVLVKLCTDRQLLVPEEVISYLLTRMERSLTAARQLVAALDAASLREKRRITRPLAARVLAELTQGEKAQNRD